MLGAAASVERQGPDLFHLQKIYVLPRYQGIGAGAALFRHAVAYIRSNLDFHRTLYLRAQAPAMLAILETVWLQLGPTMRALYGRLQRQEPPRHHRLILAALKAGDEPGLRLAIRADVTQGLRHLLAGDVATGARRPAGAVRR